MASLEGWSNFLKSNEAINKLSNLEPAKGIVDSIENVLSRKDSKESLIDAITRAHSKGNAKDAGISAARVAGSFVGASTAYRVVSGGGLYKDRNGNTNIAGIPFV